MSDRFMNYEFLIQSQLETVKETEKTWLNLTSTWPNVINLFFRLLYFVDEKHAADTPESIYSAFCFQQYYRLPYTLQSVYTIWQVGEYLEASILVRHLLESFVQIRYFLKHKDRLRAHQIAVMPKELRVQFAGSSKDQIKFNTMFEELAPGSYEYYRRYSSFAHSNPPAGIFSFDIIPPIKGSPGRIEPRLGVQFNRMHSALLMNQILMLLIGFITYYPKCFPSYETIKDQTIEAERLEIFNDLNNWKKCNADLFPQGNEWHNVMDTLIR